MNIEDKQKILKEWVNSLGTKLMVQELNKIAKATLREQLDYDPYTEQDKIMRAKQLRFVLKEVLPKTIEHIVNYEVPIKQKWSFVKWFKQISGSQR